MKIHYLDNSATTAVCEAAADAALYMMTQNYGNPSSLHKMGIESEAVIERARKTIADSLLVDEKTIFFTSGGTEANNTALFGAAEALKRRGKRIIVSSVEHSSVYESALHLREMGYDVCFIPVDDNGVIKMDELLPLLSSDTILVSVMAVNNETGAIQPTEAIAKAIRQHSHNALFHVDAVQAYCKIPLKPKRWGVDLMSVSAHKIHGPKGIGALYIRDGAAIRPLLYGGEQQKKMRPGTESAPLIAAFSEAVCEADVQENLKKVGELNRLLRERLADIDEIAVNSGENALPYILNLSAPGIRSETMLHHLEQGGVYVSSSSACAKGKRSYVLAAMGLPDSRIDSAIRVSFSKHSTPDDVDALCEGLISGIKNLQKVRS